MLHVENNEAKAVELKYASMPEGWKDDPKELNSFSWWCFENLVHLEEAEALARRGGGTGSGGFRAGHDPRHGGRDLQRARQL